MKWMAALGNSDLGRGVGASLFLLVVSSPIWLGIIAAKWDGHLYDRKGCLELQEIKGEIYKINSCDNTVEKLEGEPPTPPAK